MATGCTSDYQEQLASAQPVSSAPASLSRARVADAPVTVSLTFDDQRVSQSVVLDALREAGNLKGTFFVISTYVNNVPGDPPDDHPESLSLDQLLEIERDGHEIGAHSRTHEDLTTLSPDQLQYEVCGSRNDLQSFGLGSVTPIVSFAYPYGAHDAGVEAMVASCGFTSARTTDSGPEHLPPADPFATRTKPGAGSILQGDSVANIEEWVSSAEAGDWVQLSWHDIVSAEYGGTDEYQETLEDFRAVLDFLATEQAQGRIVIKTVGDAIAGSQWNGEP